ncbi:MAG: cytochrome c3 family protein [Caldilineaceae bacterium]
MRKITLLAVIVALLSLVVVGQAFAAEGMVEQGTVVAQDATPTPEAEEEAEDGEEAAMPSSDLPVEIPFLSAWMNSPHADAEAEAFRHWDDDDQAEFPASCAKCHSTPGMIDYMGADGSEPLSVDAAAPIGSVVECMACHNDAARGWDSVVMPSGVVLANLGPEARCMECHQGRASTVSVVNALEGVGATEEDMDTVFEDLGFINIHYYAAAATKYGGIAKGGFQYPGESYEAFFMHVPGVSACTDCHSAHTTELDMEKCATCHEGVAEVEDLHDIRMAGSLRDYDGDGDMEEGVYYELEGIEEVLYEAIRTYAAEVVGTPIMYNPAAYPYFFTDPNGNGEADGDEERYASWTPRLLEAAYNYQVAHKDPGAYAHGGKYIIQLVYDSIASLNEAIAEPIDMTAMSRNDVGHFDGSKEAFRHWDEDGAVSGSCAKCHTADGLPFFLGEAVTVSGAPSNGLQCNTCHSDLSTYELYTVEAVEFPSGAVLVSEEPGDNLCMQCHQGRLPATRSRLASTALNWTKFPIALAL